MKEILRDARNAFARASVDLIFTRLTDGYRRSLRAEELVYEVAELCPGLCPTRKEVESDSRFFLAEKEGVEIAQSDFLAHVLAHRTAGLYLIHSMLQPFPSRASSWKNSGRTAGWTWERPRWRGVAPPGFRNQAGPTIGKRVPGSQIQVSAGPVG